jgi:hypothetical protein
MASRRSTPRILTVSIVTIVVALLVLTGCKITGFGPPDPDPLGWTSRFLYADNLAWASRREMSSAQFTTIANEYAALGYMIVDIDVKNVDLATRYSLVAHENRDGRGWALHRDLTSQEYNDLWTSYRDDGYRPLDVEAYMLDGVLRFAGIWIENVEGLAWSSIRNMTSAEYADYFEARREEGMRPIDIEIYPTASGLRVAAIWYENVDGLAWTQLRNIDRDRYQQEATDHGADGYLMIDFESYEGVTEQLYAAIWEKPVSRPAYQIRTDRSELQYANLWRTYRDRRLSARGLRELPRWSVRRYLDRERRPLPLPAQRGHRHTGAGLPRCERPHRGLRRHHPGRAVGLPPRLR